MPAKSSKTVGSSKKKGRLSLGSLIAKMRLSGGEVRIDSGRPAAKVKAPAPRQMVAPRVVSPRPESNETLVVPDTNYLAFMFPDTGFSDGPK